MPTYQQLVTSALQDESVLVRSYAVLSLSDIAGEAGADLKELRALLVKAAEFAEEGVMASCFRGLYRLGEERYLQKLMDLISSSDYRVRCQVVHLLGDLITDQNREQIITMLRQQRIAEDAQAVRSTIEKVLCVHEVQG